MVRPYVVQAIPDGYIQPEWGIAWFGKFYPMYSRLKACDVVTSFIEDQDDYTSVNAQIIWETKL